MSRTFSTSGVHSPPTDRRASSQEVHHPRAIHPNSPVSEIPRQCLIVATRRCACTRTPHPANHAWRTGLCCRYSLLDAQRVRSASPALWRPVQRIVRSLVRLRLDLNIELFRRLREVLEESRAEPALDVQFGREIPVAASIPALPFQPELVSREWSFSEKHNETAFSVRYISDDPVNHRVRAAYEGFLRKADARVVEHPHVEVFIWSDNVDCVHGLLTSRLRCAGRGEQRRRAHRVALEPVVSRHIDHSEIAATNSRTLGDRTVSTWTLWSQ